MGGGDATVDVLWVRGVPTAVFTATGTGVETKADGVEDATLAEEGVGLHGLDVEDVEYRQGEGESSILVAALCNRTGDSVEFGWRQMISAWAETKLRLWL